MTSREQEIDGAGSKRKGDGIQQPESTAKRGAPRACLSCRGRKVRCDVTIQGSPCNNCRLDNLGCVLGKPRRAVASRTTDATSERSNNTEEFPVSLTFEGLGDDPGNVPSQANDSSVLPNAKSLDAPGASSMRLPLQSTGPYTQNLPPYIRPLPLHLKPVDTEYLTAKGSLLIPDDELQCELLRLYIQYVHPFMPILDLPVFLLSVARHDAKSRVSLLLFQAVMFAAVAYIDTDYCITRGYESRRSMRKDFFERVRLLYDLDAEPDRIARLQALLLMTYWYERVEDEKDTWHWTGIALSLAQVLGIHRNPDQLDISPKAKSGRKRIWWACYVRDRLLALGIRRPARIRPQAFNVPDITIEDLKMEPFDEAVLKFLGNPPIADSETQNGLMLCFVELTQLCVHIGDILLTQYSVLGNDVSRADETLTMMVVPKKSAQQMQDMEKCDLKLRGWMQKLDSPCRYKEARSRQERQQTKSQSILHLHQALMHMIYLTSTAILHRPQAQRSSDGSEENISTRRSADKIADAAGGITQVVYDLHQRNQLRFASTSAIPAILSAILIHLNDIASSRQDARYASIGQFYQCWQALQYLRDMYASADHVVWFVEAVIRRTRVHIPMLSLTSTAPRSNTKSQVKQSQSQRNTEGHVRISSTGDQRVEEASNSLITPVTIDSAPAAGTGSGCVAGVESSTGLQMFSGNVQGQFTSSIMVPMDPQNDPWTDFDAETNFLQALVHFDADPNFFPPTHLGP
ncbi:cutinase transcription factor 1 beta [Fusarium avenaceum]|nr:cutinase transcription factor 1 beta [Fusarium avenaceum]